jgi:hypothetical protein
MWYSVTMLFESSVDDGNDEAPLCEESILLFEAKDEESAHNAAVQHAKTVEVNYANLDKKNVAWRFVKVVEVQDLCETQLFSGVEVHSRLFRKPPR